MTLTPPTANTLRMGLESKRRACSYVNAVVLDRVELEVKVVQNDVGVPFLAALKAEPLKAELAWQKQQEPAGSYSSIVDLMME